VRWLLPRGGSFLRTTDEHSGFFLHQEVVKEIQETEKSQGGTILPSRNIWLVYSGTFCTAGQISSISPFLSLDYSPKWQKWTQVNEWQKGNWLGRQKVNSKFINGRLSL
jgi:hypothetical protein